jgi:hypothetical protein
MTRRWPAVGEEMAALEEEDGLDLRMVVWVGGSSI